MGKVQQQQTAPPPPPPPPEMTRNKKKKKGRPSKNPSPLSPSPKPPIPNLTGRRSTRRNPNHFNSPEFDDDDDERKEKKVKLVVRLPQSDDKSSGVAENQRHSRDSDSGSDSESEDREGFAKKRKINGVDEGFGDVDLDQVLDDVKATDTPLHESQLESGPTTPLPDKKLLVFILDRLQKKDTYGVFSEPVDPNELPDYFEIIEQPMDFGTVRKKLGDGTYKNLEELEADVFLICSNAMKYNAPDTVYHRQARSIQELATRDFKYLRHEGDDGELQPKVVRRGRPPSSKNNQKKSLETSPVKRVGTELSSGATLANEDDKSNSYNLRKGSALYRFRSTDSFVSSYSTRNGENEWSIDWNNEFPASILRADMKHTKKQFTVDENRRDTYRQFQLSPGNNSPLMSNSIGNMKRLVPMGLHEALAYARSLARYAANLGPVAWKTASKKIETALPPGLKYGPGWVGDSETPSQPPLSFPAEEKKPSISNVSSFSIPRGPPEVAPAGQGDNGSSWRTQFLTQQNPRNGFTGMFGHDLSKEQAELQKRRAPSPPPDLNVRVVPTGSPSSSLQIGSPKQPDHLELQL